MNSLGRPRGPVRGLDPRVDVIFEDGAEYFSVHSPYNRDFLDCLGANNIRGSFDRLSRRWRFHHRYFDDVWKLLFDFFSERG